MSIRVSPRQRRRWLVHLALIVTAIVSLVFEFVLTIHVVVGLVFVGFVVVHLAQRRRATGRLVRHLVRARGRYLGPARLAWADLSLAVLSGAMLLSGLWDWAEGHPTRIRWHALTGVALAALLIVHTLRRRRRLRTSKIA